MTNRRVLPNRNARKIFGMIRKSGTVSKQDLLNASGLTSSTLTRTLAELIDLKAIREVGYGSSTGGRKPILYRINPQFGYTFGLDISRTHVMLILYDMSLAKKASRRWIMDETLTPDRLFDELTKAVNEMLAECGVCSADLLGLGIGAVGPLDRDSGIILTPPMFPARGWEHVVIGPTLEKTLGLPVILDNGANTALWGEYWHSSVDRYRHLLYVHAGIGIRTAMIADGKLMYGAVDMEGAVGQMVIRAERNLHGTGGASWESCVSLHALLRRVERRLQVGGDSALAERAKGRHADLTYSDLLHALKEQDSLVVEAFRETAVYFGIGLANLLNILHPEKVILGGPVFSDNVLFFRIATQTAIKNTYHYPAYQVVFAGCRLGEEAVAYGAAIMVIDMLEKERF
ncbi:MAG TPA: ROK family protein [Bacilli bacterium]